MESETATHVLTAATIENVGDVWNAAHGAIPVNAVRRVHIDDARVDTDETLLSMPAKLIEQLGLIPVSWKGDGDMYSAVRLTIQGRSCTLDVLEVPNGGPVSIGQIPLLHLDLVIDPRNGQLIGNPAHGGVHTYELY